MGDPFKPRSKPPSRVAVGPFVTRLRALGASEDEVAAVVAAWGNGGYSEAEKRAVRAMSDGKLRAALDTIRREHYEGTHTFEEEEADRRALALAQAQRDLRSSWPPAKVLEWVGSDPYRASAVMEAEMAAPRPRSVLVASLRELLQLDADFVISLEG